jgi:glycolate oxidase iron-sulfur subunit
MPTEDAQLPPKPGPPRIEPELLAACIHCGLCLPACPTYLATGRETESPRGRIYLLNEWNQGRQQLTPRLVEHIDSCLGCLGCQTACPSGVEYEKIINQARPALVKTKPGWYRLLMRMVFRGVLPNYFLLRWLGFFLRLWQWLKLNKLIDLFAGKKAQVQAIAVGANGHDAPHLIPPPGNIFVKLSQWNQFLPAVPDFHSLPRRSWRPGKKEGKAQLFSGCVMDVFYNHVNNACMRLLAAQNRMAENPPQTCCGALAFHAGESDITIELAKKNIHLFQQTEGPIAVSAAGCGAMLKEYGHLLRDNPEWAARAKAFSDRIVDITECLADGQFGPLPKELPTELPRRIAYHAACHLVHAQKVRGAPAALLNDLVANLEKMRSEPQPEPQLDLATESSAAPKPESQPAPKPESQPAPKPESPSAPQPEPPQPEPASVPTLVALQEAEHCCGSAGIYNILHPEMALAVLERKMDNIEKTGADLVVTTNPGCILQLEAGARLRGLKVRVEHLCQLLDDIYCEKS